MQCVETIQGLPKLERAWFRNSPDHKHIFDYGSENYSGKKSVLI